MISDLLDFARTGMAAPPVMLNLESTVSQVLQNLALEIQESAAVITMGPLPTVYSDEVHLLRVFQNLISNAIKYRSKQPPKIHISARVNGNGWIIKVKDTGLGISGEYLSKIFMPFVRLENHNVTGTGLGLAACKKAIESLGGTIWVESEPGAGSTFLFTIPGASHSTNHSTTDNH
jgi:light-regulated signal transduction histidine kinase (bacteriophytochrome)